MLIERQMDALTLSLLFSAGLIAFLHVGFRALLVHAVDLRTHHPERYSGAWRALGDLAPSARVESLRTTIIGTLVALAIVVVLAVTGAINGLARSPTGLLVAIIGLAILTVSGSAAAFVLARRRGPRAER
jgi:glycerol uptake facilitator-like aquaporin